jgi:leader peptidase (prepilin peptidase)/N-methyltransferase
MFAVLNNVLVQHLAPIDFLVQIGLAMLPVAGVYLVVYLIGEKLLKKSLIGFGDVRFGLVVGLLVNWVGAVLVLFGANLLGTLAMIPLLVTRRKTMDSKVPFGPFLIAATFLTFLFLPDLVDLVENYLVLL